MPCLRDEIVQVCNEYVIPAKQSHAQRFHRALHRIESVVPSDSWVEAFAPTFVNPADKYRKLLNDSVPEPAIAFLRSQILSSGDNVVSLDVHMWAMLLRAALFGGSEWLEINVEGSDIWSNLMVVWLTANDVARPYTNHGERRPELIGFDIFLSTYREPSGCHISIIDLPDTNDPLPLNRAIQKFMYVSICDTIVRLGFPSLCQGEDYSNVPGDIRLHLALIQSSCAQKTSTPWDRAAGDLETSEMSHVLGVLRSYLNYELTFGGYKVKEQYPSSVRAIYLALRDVVTSDTFGRSTTLTQRDERNILALLFRAGNMLDSSHAIADSRWITDSVLVLEKMQHVLFGETSQENLRLPCQLLADAVAYAQKSRSSNLFPTLGVKLYTGLMKQDWLSLLLGRYRNPGNGSYYWLPWSEDLSYPAIPFLVSAYMDGLEQLRPVAPELFEAVLKNDLRSTLICSTLCATLLLADVERQKCLETVRSFIEPETWLKSFHTAAAFLRSEAGVIHTKPRATGDASMLEVV
ncbi:hypothetical protein CPB85DRAFT_412084 [Mucidula mucida]|nr:hypothetical protein CPB85DRAFT_412084 [Mucidula mucida]